MNNGKSDRLLTTSRYLLGILMGLCVFAGTLVTIGLGALLTFERNRTLAKLAARGITEGGYPAFVAAFALIVIILALAFLFLSELLRIVRSVERGDPFVPANADRLRRMAWLNLGIQLILFVLAGISASFGNFRAALVAEDAFSIATGATLLTLVLFILARVFRVGAEMREELEGTV
ncbi:MAG: DUF2975 domain-containing protein [Pseudomonadota bacterium]|nr:DUF2975 domain-containing protein [Pseudomonadota bacterium]